MIQGSFVLKQFHKSRSRVAFDVTDAGHIRAAMTFFNPESANHHKWLDEDTGTVYHFIDELEYPSLPDMVREKLAFAQIRSISGKNDIEDSYQILARMLPGQLLPYECKMVDGDHRVNFADSFKTGSAMKDGNRMMDIAPAPSGNMGYRGVPTRSVYSADGMQAVMQ